MGGGGKNQKNNMPMDRKNAEQSTKSDHFAPNEFSSEN